MTKDLMHTIIGYVMAAMLALDTYYNKLQGDADVMSVTVIVGALGAVVMAVYGKWAKKGDKSKALSSSTDPVE